MQEKTISKIYICTFDQSAQSKLRNKQTCGNSLDNSISSGDIFFDYELISKSIEWCTQTNNELRFLMTTFADDNIRINKWLSMNWFCLDNLNNSDPCAKKKSIEPQWRIAFERNDKCSDRVELCI